MFFQKMRKQTKTIIIVVVVAMAAGLLYAGGISFFGGNQQQVAQAAVAATVNGQAITYYDFQQVFISQLQQIEQQQGVLPGRAYEIVKYQALETLVSNVLVQQEIEGRKISASNDEINEELQEFIELFPSKEDYELQLQYMGWTEAQLKTALAEQIKFEKLQNEIAGDIEVTDEEIINAYEEVEASHILIKPPVDDEEGWAEAEAIAFDIYAQTTPENFADTAKTNSADGSATNGGDLGFFGRGVMVPEFEETAFSLQVGEISEPIKSEFGYHIIMVTDRKDAVGEEFESEKENIIEQIRSTRVQEEVQAWYAEIRESADVVVADHQMKAYQHALNGEYDDAVNYYNLAIEDNPNDGYLNASLGNVYGEMENRDEAIAQYEQAVEKITNDSSLYIALGNLYRDVEKVDEAVEMYLKASELEPNDIYTQLVLLSNVNNLDRPEEAQVIEERIDEIQKRQEELWKAQQEALEAQEQANSALDEEDTADTTADEEVPEAEVDSK